MLSSGQRIQQIRSRKKTLKNTPALQVTTYNSPSLPVSTLVRYYFPHCVTSGEPGPWQKKQNKIKEGHKTMISNDAKFITNWIQDPGLKNE